MRTFLNLITAALLFAGCSGSESPPAAASRTGGIADLSAAAAPRDARHIVDQAIAAFGGSDARNLLRRGSVKMIVVGDLPGMSEQFETDTLTFDAHFDLPDFERRDIYGAPDGRHLIFITNSGTLWIGNDDGKGQAGTAPPAELYRGPFLIGIMQSFIEMRDTSTRLVLVDDDSNSGVDVVEAYLKDELASRVSFDRKSHLPVQVDKFAPSMQAETIGEPERTFTKLSRYQKFGSATLPTDVVAFQRGKQVFRVRLESADFDSPVAKKHFVIPDGSPPADDRSIAETDDPVSAQQQAARAAVDAAFAQARKATTDEELVAAIATLEIALETDPENFRLLHGLAALNSTSVTIERVIHYDRHLKAADYMRRLLKIDPTLADNPLYLKSAAEVYFREACALAEGKKQDKALEALRAATAAGFEDFAKMEGDPDLESVRSLPEFAEFLAKAREAQRDRSGK